MAPAPGSTASNGDTSPLREPPALRHTHYRRLPWRLGTGFVRPCIGLRAHELNRCISTWTHGHLRAYRAVGLRCGRRLRRGRRTASRRAPGSRRPRRATWPARRCRSGARRRRAPGAGDRARLTAELGDQLAGAATGHTLPRPMGRPGSSPSSSSCSPAMQAGEVSVLSDEKACRRTHRGPALGLVTRSRGGGAAPDPSRPGFARPLLRRGRQEHDAFVAQLLLRRVRAGGQRLDRQAARRPVAAGGERQAVRVLLDDAQAARGARGNRGGAAAVRGRAAHVEHPGGVRGGVGTGGAAGRGASPRAATRWTG